LSDIGSHTNDLDNLTRGTQEWRDAVFALNQEVSNLLEKYPELSNFVSMENGVLTIDYKKEVGGETANDVIRKTENAAIDASIIE
jgi:hypothetical protein